MSIANEISKLNNKFIPMVIKTRIIKKIKSNLDLNNLNMLSDELKTLFSRVKSNKALKVIGEIMQNEIISLYDNNMNLPFDVWNDKIVNSIFNDEINLIFFILNTDDKEKVNKVINLLSSDNKNKFLNSLKNGNVSLFNREIRFINNISNNSFLDELLINLNLQYVVDLIHDSEVKIEIKNKILKDRKNEIMNFLKNSDMNCYYKLLSSNIDEKYKKSIISNIPSNKLLLFIKSKEVSNNIKEIIYNDRLEEIKKIITEKIDKYNRGIEHFSDDKNIYPPMLEEIIKRVDIDTLIKEIIKPSISNELNDLIINSRSNDLKNYFNILPENNYDQILLAVAFKNHLISDDSFLRVLNNLDIVSIVNYLFYNELPIDIINKVFDSCKDRIYNLLNDKSKMSYITTTNLLLLKNLPEDLLTNIILRLDKNTVYKFFKENRTNTILKEKIYELRRDDINESINTSIKEYYDFLIDDSLSKEDKMAIISSYNIDSLSYLLPIYNIVNKANISPDEFIINSDYFVKICNILYQDDLFNKLNSVGKDEQKKMISNINHDDLIELFFNRIESSYSRYEDEKERETLRLIYNDYKNDIIDYCDKNTEKYNLLLKIVPISNVEEIINKFNYNGLLKVALENDQSDYIKRIVIQKLTEGIDDHGLDFCEIIPYIKGNADIFIKKFDNIYKILESCLPNVNTFFKHALFDEIDFVSFFDGIIENNMTDNFIKVCMNLLNKLYNVNGDNLVLIDSFLKILKNYNKYPELCNNIANNNREITENEKLKIEYLFDRDVSFDGIVIKEIDDIDNLSIMINSQINNVIENIENYDIKTIKNIICSTLFSYDIKTIDEYLSIFGNVLELKKLKFNNRDNPQIFDLIDEMIIYVSIMEDVININDREQLLVLLKNISSNYNEISKLNIFFSQFEKKMKRLYEVDSQINLTNINSLVEYNDLLNTELTKKYGVDVLDFSDRQYVLYAHVKSDSESVKELVNGNSSGSKNFICLSPISYRGQNYYGDARIIFGYDVIPDGNFICSSKLNMGSNGAISRNSNRVEQIIGRQQRGILESSDNGIKSNPETLSFREGLKPSCIIIPKNCDSSIKSEAFEIAKEYGLKVVLTQEIKKSIENPKPLIIRKEKEKAKKRDKEIASLKVLMEELLNASKYTNLKKIAILSDPHGLYEPTLAILEDARKEGITEIYSLGDNIGTGPNPGEVVDLLENYNVKSVIGNHELYALLGTKSFEKHFRDIGAMEEAENNSRWTRIHLTDRQLEIIRNYPEHIELLVGGKKILLKHFINDFNTGNLVINPENYDKIFQGHIHFASEKGKIETLRGTGIGYSPSDLNTGEAYYIILSENKDGGFDIERKNVSFDLNNLRHDINASNLDIQGKDKVSSWTSTKSNGR